MDAGHSPLDNNRRTKIGTNGMCLLIFTTPQIYHESLL